MIFHDNKSEDIFLRSEEQQSFTEEKFFQFLYRIFDENGENEGERVRDHNYTDEICDCCTVLVMVRYLTILDEETHDEHMDEISSIC